MFRDSTLWKTSLGADADDVISRLRSAYLSARERVGSLASHIAADLPGYTVHDITHMDALWVAASRIAGPEYPLNPLEGFVLGCAILVHDLAMSVAAYPGGAAEIRAGRTYADVLAGVMASHLGRQPSVDELLQATEETHLAATQEFLRARHAFRARELPGVEWESDGVSFFLIEDGELRTNYAELIGRLAASHWWNVQDLRSEFQNYIGPPGGFPADWQVDPLKLAALLRTADASHLDALRAPAFERALAQPRGVSADHWKFQERLQQPIAAAGLLHYGAARPFSIADAAAWWVCCDLLRLVDRELRDVDALLHETGRPQFVVRGVAYVQDVDQLARVLPVSGWAPVDARLHVSDVVDLVHKLGGAELYGSQPYVGLRELVQNAADACIARDLLEQQRFGGPVKRSPVEVALYIRHDGTWLSVTDGGIGMSRSVLAKDLMAFGSSFWVSRRAGEEYPGLLSSGFAPRGRYGIGFFAVFMLGDSVRVTSRHLFAAQDETSVLEFRQGLAARPLIRPAEESEWLPAGGTRVEVLLKVAPEASGGLLRAFSHRGSFVDLPQMLRSLFPALDVDLMFRDDESPSRLVSSADDWMTIAPCELMARSADERLTPETLSEFDDLELTSIFLGEKQVARVAAVPPRSFADDMTRHTLGALVANGGVRSETTFDMMVGVIMGEPVRAARDGSVPLAPVSEFRNWASSTVATSLGSDLPPDYEKAIAEMILGFGADPASLRLFQVREGMLTCAAVGRWSESRTVITLLTDFLVPDEVISSQRVLDSLADDVLVLDMSPAPSLPGKDGADWFEEGDLGPLAPLRGRYYSERCATGAAVAQIAGAWRVDAASLLASVEEQEYGSTDSRTMVSVGSGPFGQVDRRCIVLRRPSS